MADDDNTIVRKSFSSLDISSINSPNENKVLEDNLGRKYFFKFLGHSLLHGGGGSSILTSSLDKTDDRSTRSSSPSGSRRRSSRFLSSSVESTSTDASSFTLPGATNLPPAPTDHRKIIRKGWLHVRKSILHTWKKQWIMLFKDKLNENGDTTASIARYNKSEESTNVAPKRSIVLGSTSRVLVVPQKKGTCTSPTNRNSGSIEQQQQHTSTTTHFEFHIYASSNSNDKPLVLAAETAYDMGKWVENIESVILESSQAAAFKQNYSTLWKEGGLDPFYVRYGIRKRNGRGTVQSRLLEFNFAENILCNTKRGQIQTSVPFGSIHAVRYCAPLSAAKTTNDDSTNGIRGIELVFKSSKTWFVFFDTKSSRDDMYDLLLKILSSEGVTEADLRSRWQQLVLKKGTMERKNTTEHHVGFHATLKGVLRFHLCENELRVFSASTATTSSSSSQRPYYMMPIREQEISVDLKAGSNSVISIGRYSFLCKSSAECMKWKSAIDAAIGLSTDVINQELQMRYEMKLKFSETVEYLRRMLSANVAKHNSSLPAAHDLVQLMLKTLWVLRYPSEPFDGNASPRWLEIGFQRGGPESDLRSSGILGLHCLTYFVLTYPQDFDDIIVKQNAVLSGGRKLNYPVAIACINLAVMLASILGIGRGAASRETDDADLAATVFATLVAESSSEDTRTSEELEPLETKNGSDSLLCREEILGTYRATFLSNHCVVFEELFCKYFKILDAEFIAMDAGYMEFGEVLARVREIIYDTIGKQIS